MADVVISKPTLRRLSHIKSRQPRTEIHASQCPIDRHQNRHIRSVRDWSLITGRGVIEWENRGSEIFCTHPQDRVKHLAPQLLKSGNLLRPSPSIWLKRQATCIKTTSKLVVPPPPSAWLKLFPSPPCLRGKTSHAHSPPVLLPPPPPSP